MVAKKLSSYLKKIFSPQIDERDGRDCFYCEQPFQSRLQSIISLSQDDNPQEYDHLNNDDTDNRLENLVKAHRLCNQRKKQGWKEFEMKARTKLRDNERSANIPQRISDKVTPTEIDTNELFTAIAVKELAFWLIPQKNGEARKQTLPRKEFKDYLTGKGIKEVGHASQNTFDRILDALCTKEFYYIKEKDENKKWIIRLRTPEDKDIFDLD